MKIESCEHCDRPCAIAQVESSHPTSEGVVRYLKCPCGQRKVEILRLVLDTNP